MNVIYKQDSSETGNKLRIYYKEKMKLRSSQSARAGILFPISRVQNKLRKLPQQVKRVSKV